MTAIKIIYFITSALIKTDFAQLHVKKKFIYKKIKIKLQYPPVNVGMTSLCVCE